MLKLTITMEGGVIQSIESDGAAQVDVVDYDVDQGDIDTDDDIEHDEAGESYKRSVWRFGADGEGLPSFPE